MTLTENITPKQPYNWNIYYEMLKSLSASTTIENLYHEHFKCNYEDVITKTRNQELTPKEQICYFSQIAYSEQSINFEQRKEIYN